MSSVDTRRRWPKKLVVFISGPAGIGKSTLAKALVEHFDSPKVKFIPDVVDDKKRLRIYDKESPLSCEHWNAYLANERCIQLAETLEKLDGIVIIERGPSDIVGFTSLDSCDKDDFLPVLYAEEILLMNVPHIRFLLDMPFQEASETLSARVLNREKGDQEKLWLYDMIKNHKAMAVAFKDLGLPLVTLETSSTTTIESLVNLVATRIMSPRFTSLLRNSTNPMLLSNLLQSSKLPEYFEYPLFEPYKKVARTFQQKFFDLIDPYTFEEKRKRKKTPPKD